MIKKINEDILLFSDLSFAFGRVNVNFKDIDIGMMVTDNLYGIKGKGIIYKRSDLKITNDYSIELPSVVALAKMVEVSIDSLMDRERKVVDLNSRIVDKLKDYKGLLLNSNKYSIPYIINISFMDRYTEDIVNSMNDYEVYLSNADENSQLSTSVMAVYGDKIRSLTSVRISLSHLTSYRDVDYFLEVFNNIYYERGVSYEKDNSND